MHGLGWDGVTIGLKYVVNRPPPGLESCSQESTRWSIASFGRERLGSGMLVLPVPHCLFCFFPFFFPLILSPSSPPPPPPVCYMEE